MPNIGILLALIAVSAIPAVAAFLWFRLARFPVSPRVFLVSLFAGATSVFAALFLQNFVTETGMLPPLTDRTSLLLEIFVRIAFTEELARLFLLVPLFFAFRRFNQMPASPGGVSADAMAKASGLVAGLGFGILESATYGAAYPINVLFRALITTPLHAACGSRVGASIATFRERPALAVFQFLSAVAIHGIFNLLVVTPARFAPWVAIFVAFSALASSIQMISRGMKAEDDAQ